MSRLFAHCLDVDKSLFECENAPIQRVDHVHYFTIICNSRQLKTALSEKWVNQLGPSHPVASCAATGKTPCVHLVCNSWMPGEQARCGMACTVCSCFWKLEYMSPHSYWHRSSLWSSTVSPACWLPVGERAGWSQWWERDSLLNFCNF